MNYVLVKVSDIASQSFRCSVIAHAEKKNGALVLRDESGSFEVDYEENVNPGLYRVFLTRIGDKFIVDILQPLTKVEENLFKKAKEVYIGLEHV